MNRNIIYTSVTYYNENMEPIESKLYTEGESVIVKKELHVNQKKFLESKTKLQEFTSSLGGFVHVAYVNDKLLFNDTNLKVADITRLIYLATYLGHYKTSDNMLVEHDNVRKIKPMTKETMKCKLKLKDRTFRSFVSAVKKEGILIEENNNFYLNELFFKKGELKKVENEGYTRVFVSTTRFLYENCSTTQHKILGYVYRLIPYIHYETNRICFNPKCEEFKDAKEMNIKDICNILNISDEDGNKLKIRNKLLSFKIKYQDETYCLLAYNTVKTSDKFKEYFSVNPFVIWKGNSINSIKKMLESDFNKKDQF